MRLQGIITMLGAALFAFGCTQAWNTNPPRAATELYLLSVASENAATPLLTEELRGRLIYVDAGFMSDRDHTYLVATARARLLEGGARLAGNRSEADVIVELRTPGVSIDRSEFLLGIPGLPIGQIAAAVGVPPTTLTTPELAVIKNLKQWGTAGIAYVAYWRETGEILASSGPHIGRSYREDWSFFGISGTTSDIPPAEPPDRIGGPAVEDKPAEHETVETP